jgi:hypothetical protein
VALLVCVLAAAFLAVTPPREAQAAGADTNTYYAEVKYYDNIQMKYIVQHGIDEYWTTTGDVPIGGFLDGSGNQLLAQAYCVDAKVAFHGSAETKTTWPKNVTTDTTTNGYVVASPLAVSDSVRANLPSLYWLAVNGFRGELNGANNLADIRARYAALENNYKTSIDATIAVMATKAAVWNFTDPTFALLSTSLVPHPDKATDTQKARYRLMVALMKKLVSDARANGLALATTTLNVQFDNSTASFTQSVGDWYYGPIKVNVSSSNSTGTPEEVYLTASGMYASEFAFVNSASFVAVALPKATMYGSQQKAPYVNNGDSFYLKIPAATVGKGALINVNQPTMNFSFLALHGLARSANVTYSGTPAIMTWQGPAASASGAQDWQHVQAFIGFVENMQASLYGEGHLLLRGNSDNASIQVSKAVQGATDTADAGSFVFTLEVFDTNLSQWVPVPLVPAPLAGANISGNAGLTDISPDGVFSLADGSPVNITGLPLGTYRVSEQASVDGYSAVHQLSSGLEEAGFVAEVVLGQLSPSRSVAFTNTITVQPQTVTGRIDVGKLVDTPAATPDAGRFTFTLETYDSARAQWVPVPLVPEPLAGANISGTSDLTAPSPGGTFTLAGRNSVSITGLPLGRYRVSEQVGSAPTYTTTYRLDAAAVTGGTTAEVILDGQATGHAVSFTNTIIPDTPDEPDKPDKPDKPDTPSKPSKPNRPVTPAAHTTPGPHDANTVIPATGDNSGMQLTLLATLLLSGGIAALLHRVRRASHPTRP